MIGVADYKKDVPRGVKENLEYRQWLLKKCQVNAEFRRGIREACKRDVIFFVNSFGIQFNPNKIIDETGPFVCWDFQDDAIYEVIEHIVRRKDLCISKSREMGATYMALFTMEWMGRFYKDKKFLLVSRSADAVDKKGDRDSLFWKFDYMHRYMPTFLGSVERKEMVLEYVENGSSVTGQASTGKAGVGGRATAIFVDEFTQIREDREVFGRTADTSKCRIFNFTHTGTGTVGYDLTQDPKVDQLILHWSQHPEKNEGLYRCGPDMEFIPLDEGFVYPPDFVPVLNGMPTGGPFPGLRSLWYDAECNRRSASDVAKDLDINPAGGTAQFYDPVVIDRLKREAKKYPPIWTGELLHTKDSAEPIELTEEPTGQLVLWVQPGRNFAGRLLKVPSGLYVIGADISTGQGATPTCFSVFDVYKKMKVAKYASRHKDPKDAAYVAVSLCKVFKNADGTPAKLIWECPGVGISFGNEVVKEIGYRHIHWRREDVKIDPKAKQDWFGWWATPRTKMELHTQFRAALRNGDYTSYDETSLHETLSYVHMQGSVEHPKARRGRLDIEADVGANHGDHVVSDALTWYLASEYEGVSQEEKEASQAPPNSVLGRRLAREEEEMESVGMWD